MEEDPDNADGDYGIFEWTATMPDVFASVQIEELMQMEEETLMEDEIKVLPLVRTDSVFLTKEMLGYADGSLSSTDLSEDEYVPGSSEEDSSDVSEPKSKKRRSKRGDSPKLKTKRPYRDAREEDPDEPRPGTKSKYKKNNKRASSSSGEEDPDEPSTRTKSKYKNNNKRASSSSGEEDPDEAASARRRKNRNPYTRYKKSVKKSRSLVVERVNGSKKYPRRKNYCVYCQEPQSKLSRHLERRHGDKVEVANALMYPPNSKKRNQQLDLLRKKGNRAHNIEALTEGKGTLVPCKRQSDGIISPKDYQHCFACYGLFKRKFLWKHVKLCPLAANVCKTLPGKTRIQALCAAAQPVSKDVSMKVWGIVNTMYQDEIAHAVKKDKYIMKVGEKLCNRPRKTASQDDTIRQIMRGLGRLLILGKKVTPLKKMADYINPEHFHHVIHAVKEVAGFDEKRNKFEKPTLAIKLGQSIQRVADIMATEAVSTQNNKKKLRVQEFRRIYNLTWNETICSAAYRTLEEKWNKPKLIPLADDVRKIHMYMTEKEYYEQLLDERTKGKSLDQISIGPKDRSEVIEESWEMSSEVENHTATPRGASSMTRGKRGTPRHQLEEEKSSEGEESVLQDEQSTSKHLGKKRSWRDAKKAKRKWSKEEANAVEKSLMDFIRMGKTPRKKDCKRCIAASPQALAERVWKEVKFYVYNRIVSDQRL